jgi:hypothetical protein
MHFFVYGLMHIKKINHDEKMLAVMAAEIIV